MLLSTVLTKEKLVRHLGLLKPGNRLQISNDAEQEDQAQHKPASDWCR